MNIQLSLNDRQIQDLKAKFEEVQGTPFECADLNQFVTFAVKEYFAIKEETQEEQIEALRIAQAQDEFDKQEHPF